jgi:hypothetical protein
MTMPSGIEELLFSMFENSSRSGKSEQSCFPQQKLQACQQADQGDLRGRTLKHAGQDEHLGTLSKVLLKHISGVEEKQQLQQEILAAKDQLPPFYMVAKGGKSNGVKMIKTAKYLETIASKVEARAVRIEKLKKFNAAFGTLCEKAVAVNTDLMKLNEGASKENVSVFKEGALAEFLTCKTDLTKRVSQLENSVLMISVNSFEDMMVKMMGHLTITPKGVSLIKAVKATEAALENLSKYEIIFENCLKGIEAKLNEVTVASKSDSKSDSDFEVY